jgi:UDP-glucose 4-epimerase
MNIILTGHKGLIGHYLKERLEKEGHKIIAAIDSRDGKDISNLKSLKIDKPVDLFIHAAAHCKINQSIENPELAHNNNSEGTFQVLEFCRKNKIPKIINFSSSRVLSEEKNPYTASKLYGEELCKAYRQCYGIKYVIIRPSTVYGPFWDITNRLIHKFIVNALEGKDLEIYGNPETKTLDFTYIDDFIDGVMLAIAHENQEFNISGNEEYNVLKLAQMIIAKTGSKSKIKFLREEIAQPQQVRVDISEIQNIGYKPKISLEEGVERTIEFYKKYLGK